MTTLKTSREIPATADQVFEAFSGPERLARWWGPEGFSNTFEICEFKEGGRWVYVMHGPDGKDYSNESRFTKIIPEKELVIEHVCKPKYRLVITLEPSEKGTLLSWTQIFEKEKFAISMKDFLTEANEQNLDRLTAEVLNGLV